MDDERSRSTPSVAPRTPTARPPLPRVIRWSGWLLALVAVGSGSATMCSDGRPPPWWVGRQRCTPWSGSWAALGEEPSEDLWRVFDAFTRAATWGTGLVTIYG